MGIFAQQQNTEPQKTGLFTPPAPKPAPSLTSSGLGSLPVLKQLTQIGSGVGTAVGKTVLNTVKAGLKVTDMVGGPDTSRAMKAIDTISHNIYQKPFENELDSVGGKVGTFIGNTAPYLMTGGPIASVVNNASKLGKGSALARTTIGAVTEGIGAFGQGYAFSGGDTKQAVNQGLFAGGFKGLTAGTGEILNKMKVPESLVGKIYRTTAKEQRELLGGRKPPVDVPAGIVERGIKGSTTEQAKQLTDGMAQTEKAIAEEFAKNGNPVITLSNPKRFISYILGKMKLLEEAGATEQAQGLRYSLNAIDDKTGQITANNALSLKRFLDGLRYEKSFMNPTEELSAQQAGLKEMADEIRGKINAIGVTDKLMKDYQFYIKALDKLSGHASRSKNNDALGLITTFLLGEGVASFNPYLIGAGVTRKVIGGTARGSTGTAQLIKNLPESGAIGQATRSGIGSLLPK